MLRSVLIIALLAGCAPGYVAVEGGRTFWRDQSNQNEIEGHGRTGLMAGIASGVQTDYGRVEMELSHRVHDLHGRNRRPHKSDEEFGVHSRVKQSADGHELRVTSLGANFWPGYRPVKWFEFYVGGGAGMSRLNALGDTGYAPYYQLGAGIVFHIGDHFSLDAGYRYLKTQDVNLDGFELGYDTDGPVVRGVYRF